MASASVTPIKVVPKLSTDDKAYQLFVANCERLGIDPAGRAVWERITRSIPAFQNLETVKASNRTGG